MRPTERISLEQELLEYERACARVGYQPTREDYVRVWTFLLLLSGAGDGTVTESMLTEAEDFQFFKSTDIKGLPDGAKDLADYLFKKPRVMSLFRIEMQDQFARLAEWKRVVDLKRKLAELTGNDLKVEPITWKE